MTVTPAREMLNRARATDAALVTAWQRHEDAEALDVLVRRYMPLARRLARRYGRSSVPGEDLRQVASLGLVKAASRFDPTLGCSFSSYAVPTILGELRRHFRDSGWSVHLPRGAQERALVVRDARDLLTNERGRPPTAQEVAQYIEIDLELVLEGLVAIQAYETNSLDQGSGEDEDGLPLADTLGVDDAAYELVERRVDVRAALRTLDSRGRQVLGMRFVEEMSQRAIADRLGVSQMQVSRILRSLLQALNERVEATGR